jgi:hypothetical protein
MTIKQAVLEKLRNLKNGDRTPESSKIVADWLDALNKLFQQLQAWLSEAVDQKLLEVHYGQRAFYEEKLGEYTAPVIRIAMSTGIEVKIAPKARFAAGTQGRVDFESIPKKYILILRGDSKWEFIEMDPSQGWRFRPLTEESFWDVLDKLIG